MAIEFTSEDGYEMRVKGPTPSGAAYAIVYNYDADGNVVRVEDRDNAVRFDVMEYDDNERAVASMSGTLHPRE
jgi:YD repeat-containing protein